MKPFEWIERANQGSAPADPTGKKWDPFIYFGGKNGLSCKKLNETTNSA